MIHEVSKVSFPAPIGTRVNMMPIVVGDESTVPAEVRGYIPLINRCSLNRGDVVYLTVHESPVCGKTQRRGGIHTEGVPAGMWGGGSWGRGGVFMASTDGACDMWDEERHDTNTHGELVAPPRGRYVKASASTLYRVSDRTPHRATSSDGYRQFFRLVGPDVYGWWAKHSTPSPFGVRPGAPVLHGWKL